MSRDLPPSRTAPQFVVRMPDEAFRDRLAEAAKGNGRSMNAEIVALLERGLNGASAWNEYAANQRLRSELMQRGHVQQLTYQLGSLGYMILLMSEYLDGTRTIDDHARETIDVFKQQAQAAIDAADRAEPERVIAELQTAMAVTKELERKLDFEEEVPSEEVTAAALARSERPTLKKALVGNLGRPGAISPYEELARTQEKVLEAIRKTQPPAPPPVQLSKGPTPSKNARARAPKKG